MKLVGKKLKLKLDLPVGQKIEYVPPRSIKNLTIDDDDEGNEVPRAYPLIEAPIFEEARVQIFLNRRAAELYMEEHPYSVTYGYGVSDNYTEESPQYQTGGWGGTYYIFDLSRGIFEDSWVVTTRRVSNNNNNIEI